MEKHNSQKNHPNYQKKRSTAKNIIKFVAGTGLCAGTGAVAGAAAYVYKTALIPKRYNAAKESRPSEKEYTEGRIWAREHARREDTATVSEDGLLLHAYYIPAEDVGCHTYAICVHGFSDFNESMGLYARVYSERFGMNIVMPDLRGYGKSDGDYVGYGYDDRRDILRWIDWILERDKDAKIVLHGISMGAATVLMTTGEPLPDQVVAAVSDSSYTSAMEEFAYVFGAVTEKSFSVPVAVLMQAVRGMTLVRAGYDLAKAAPIEAVKRSGTPTLFMHGSADEFVPSEMMPKLFDAANCRKKFAWISGASHVMGACTAPDDYWGKVEEFLREVDESLLN